MRTIMQAPSFTKDANLGTYIFCYNLRDPRNLNQSTDPQLAEAARTAMSNYLGFPIMHLHANLQNTLTFTRGEVDQTAARCAKKKTAQQGKHSCF